MRIGRRAMRRMQTTRHKLSSLPLSIVYSGVVGTHGGNAMWQRYWRRRPAIEAEGPAAARIIPLWILLIATLIPSRVVFLWSRRRAPGVLPNMRLRPHGQSIRHLSGMRSENLIPLRQTDRIHVHYDRRLGHPQFPRQSQEREQPSQRDRIRRPHQQIEPILLS